MEYQKIIYLKCKFRIRNWVEINNESWGRYDNSNIKFKMLMIRSN